MGITIEIKSVSYVLLYFVENRNGRYDIYGDLEITREYPKAGISISYGLYLSSRHAEVFMLNSTAKPETIDAYAAAQS